MRFQLLAALIVGLVAISAVGQTFNVEQPKAKGQVKVIRPGQETVAPAKSAHRVPVVKNEQPAPAAKPMRAHARASRTPRERVNPAKTQVSPPIPPPVTAEVATANVAPKPVDPLEEPLPTISELSNQQLQGKIQQSLRSAPELSRRDSVSVTVTDTEVRLDGSVESGTEKQAAERLAQSYGGNRLFKDSLQIAGSQRAAAAPTGTSTTGIPAAVGDGFAGRPKS